MKENIMKKIAILLLISSSFLIQNSFSVPRNMQLLPSPEENILATSGRTNSSPNEQRNCIDKQRNPIPCKTCRHPSHPVRILRNGDRTDGCNTWHNLDIVNKAPTKSECLQTCINRSWGPALSKNRNRGETTSSWEKRITKHSDTLNKNCQTKLNKYLKENKKNTLESWCNLQNSRPTAK